MGNNRDPLADIIEQTYRESRRDGMGIGATSNMIAAVIRSEVLDKIAVSEAEGLSKADHVMVQSIVGAASGTPAVQCRVGFEQWQWDVDQAREHAMAVLAATEAAVHDAAVMRWLTLGAVGMDKNAAMTAIVDLRRFRGDVDREDWRPPQHEDIE